MKVDVSNMRKGRSLMGYLIPDTIEQFTGISLICDRSVIYWDVSHYRQGINLPECF